MMWYYLYQRATEITAERYREADEGRLAHLVRPPRRASLRERALRAGALVAVGLARRLDECVAREAFERLGSES